MRGSIHSRRASGAVEDDAGTDSASSYQRLRDHPGATQFAWPSASATIGAKTWPSVGMPTTTSAPRPRAASAIQPPMRLATTIAAWLAMKPATAISP